MKSLIEAGQIYREGEGWGRRDVAELAIPQSIKEVIGRRLNRLSKPCADMLQAAAALGKTFAFNELAAVSLLDEEALLDGLDEAGAAQLIREDGSDAFTFTHDKIRETLLKALNPVRLRRLHQRIGEGLERLYAAQLDAHAAGLAYHFFASRDWLRGLAYARQAAENAESVFAHDEAIQYLTMARQCALEIEDRDAEAAVAEQLGDIYALRGPATSAVEHYTTALNMTQSASRRAVLTARIGAVYTEIGDMRGEAFFEEAVRELDPRTQPLDLARGLAYLGRFQHYRGRLRRAIELLDQAYVIAEPLNDPYTLLTIFSYLAGAYEHLVLHQESMAWARRSIRLGQDHDYPLATQMGLTYLSSNSLIRGEWQAAQDYITQERDLAQKVGGHGSWDWTTYYYAWRQHSLGDLSEAEISARNAYDTARQAGDVRGAAIFGARRAQIESDMGLDDSARADLNEALATATGSGNILMNCSARWAAAYYHVQCEEWSAAATILDEAVTLLVETDHRLGPLQFGPTHAEAYLGLGEVAEAARLNDEHLALARGAGSRYFEALSLRVEGQIRAAQGRFDEAEAAFAAAIAILEPSGARLELGRAFYHRARMRHDLGRADDARADAIRARDLFAACGAPRDLRRAETLLAT